MKYNQFLAGLWICLLCYSANALDFPVSDANFRQCLTSLAQKNNWVSLESITKIECHSKSIISLDGVEKFTQLQSLSLHNNQIVRASLKNLPNLQHINLAKNALSSLELVALPALEELYIFNNKLAALELKKLPKLKLLKANENQFLTFTYSDLPELEKIYIFNNLIVNFDIHHLPKLRYMDCRQNPMPDKLYDDMDELKGITFLHDGNAKDW